MLVYIFDYKYYISEYSDLQNKFTNEREGWLHFWEYGINENRRCKNYKKGIDIDFYINNNQDLINANIITHDEALHHWNRHGIFEMRQSLPQINLSDEEFLNNPYPKFLYKYNSNLIDYIKRYSLVYPHDYTNRHIINNLYNTIQKKNCIDIDLKFYKCANNLAYTDLYELLDHLHNDGLFGLIYSPKQLKNIIPTIQIYEYNNKILCEDEKTSIIQIDEYIRNNIYNKSYSELSKMLIQSYENTILSSINLCILLFIGNEERGNQIIDMIIEYKNIESFNLSICFNSYNLYNILKTRILSNFVNYRLYISNECGNDIIPTILMYDNLRESYNPEHIIKLQTKSSYEIMNDLTRYLLSKSLNSLLSEYTPESNTIGNPKYYIKINNDYFNKDLYKKYELYIDVNKKFIEATIFYISATKMKEVIEFIKNNNPNAYLFNNMYDSNRVVKCRSHIHFLERLFGVI